MSGAAAIILGTRLSLKLRNIEPDEATLAGVQGAAKVMALVIFLLAVSTVWKFMAAFSGGAEGARLSAMALLTGPLATNFWVFEVVVGMVVPLLILVGNGFTSMQAMSSAALMALVGAFFQRYDLVVVGQITPVFPGINEMPAYLSYYPSLPEFLVILGGIGITGAGVLLGERFFARVFTHRGH
jgi:molybdopterin-containing oxidoreductase family membrane subunit